jgi:hypothetical protein
MMIVFITLTITKYKMKIADAVGFLSHYHYADMNE